MGRASGGTGNPFAQIGCRYIKTILFSLHINKLIGLKTFKKMSLMKK